MDSPSSQQFSFSVSGSSPPPKSIVAPIYLPPPASSVDDSTPATSTPPPAPIIVQQHVHLNLPFTLPKGTTIIVSDSSAISGPSLSSPHSFGPVQTKPKASARSVKTKPVASIQPNYGPPPPNKIAIPRVKAPTKKKPTPKPPKPTPESKNSKPLVFLERSYDICRKIIENRPDYEELKAKLKYPHMIERDPLSLTNTSVQSRPSEQSSKSDDVAPADNRLPFNNITPNLEAPSLIVEALNNDDGSPDLPMDTSVSTITASETSMPDAPELDDFELPITQQDVDRQHSPMDTVISAFHIPISQRQKDAVASLPIKASIPQQVGDLQSPMDTAISTVQIPATEMDIEAIIIAQLDRDLNLPIGTLIGSNTVQSEAPISDVQIPVREMNGKKTFPFSIDALLTQEMKAKKASSFSIEALLTQSPRRNGDLPLPMDTQETNEKDDGSSLPVGALITHLPVDTAVQNEASISDDQLSTAEMNTGAPSLLKALLTNQIPKQDDGFHQPMDTIELEASALRADLLDVYTKSVASSLPQRAVGEMDQQIKSSTPYTRKTLKQVISCGDCSYKASEYDLKKHIKAMHPHSTTALQSLNKSSVTKKSSIHAKHYLKPSALRKEPIIHQVFIRRQQPELTINDEVALMSDPINHEPRTEISMENQQELTADQTTIMLDSINLEQEADIATIQQDSTRHDQELPVTDEVTLPETNETENRISTVEPSLDFAGCVAQIAAALNPFGGSVSPDQAMLTPVLIKQEEESDDDMPNIEPPLDSVGYESASGATQDCDFLADNFDDPEPLEEELVLKMDSPEGVVSFDQESQEKCKEPMEQDTQTKDKEDVEIPTDQNNVSSEKEPTFRQISSIINKPNQLSEEEKMEKLQRELAALRSEARNLAAQWKKQKNRTSEPLDCPSP